MKTTVLSLAVLLLLGACMSSPPGTPSAEPEPAPSGDSATRSALPTLKPLPTSPAKPTPSLVQGVPTLPPGGSVSDGEAPVTLLADLKADAARHSGVDESTITVVRSLAVTWNDGSLGCPKPGMAYTQALVPGYWVVLEANGLTYDYRATARGSFRLCS